MCYMVLVGLFGLVLPAPWGYWGHNGQPGYQVAHAYVTVLFQHNCGKLPGPAHLQELPVLGGTYIMSQYTQYFQHTCGNCPSQVAQYTQYSFSAPAGTARPRWHSTHSTLSAHLRELPVPGGTVHTVLFQHTCGNCPSQVAQYTQYSFSAPAGTARPRWHSTHSTLSAHLRELPVPGGTVHTVLVQRTCGNCPSRWHSTHSTLSAHLRELPVPGGTVHTVLFQRTCGNCPSQVARTCHYVTVLGKTTRFRMDVQYVRL
ncbi:hypothetical protein Bbelb_088510 [Branchiostoma belcheri]|nr:hypothetical protein Bbelb_088510 [Branchiostoma belcheri]